MTANNDYEIDDVPQYPGVSAAPSRVVTHNVTGDMLPVYPGEPSRGDAGERSHQRAWVGIVGLLVVLGATVVFAACSFSFFHSLVNVIGPGAIDGTIPSFTTDQLANMPHGSVIGLAASTLVGISGLIACIFATAKNRSRVAGIIGIVIGLLAPLSFGVAAAMATAASA